jgi:hypothetical protein
MLLSASQQKVCCCCCRRCCCRTTPCSHLTCGCGGCQAPALSQCSWGCSGGVAGPQRSLGYELHNGILSDDTSFSSLVTVSCSAQQQFVRWQLLAIYCIVRTSDMPAATTCSESVLMGVLRCCDVPRLCCLFVTGHKETYAERLTSSVLAAARTVPVCKLHKCTPNCLTSLCLKATCI